MRSNEPVVAGFSLLAQWENKHVSRCSFPSEQQAELTCSVTAEPLDLKERRCEFQTEVRRYNMDLYALSQPMIRVSEIKCKTTS